MNFIRDFREKRLRARSFFQHISIFCLLSLIVTVLTGCAGVDRLTMKGEETSSVIKIGNERVVPTPPQLTKCDDGFLSFNGRFVRFCYPVDLGTPTEAYSYASSENDKLDSVSVSFSSSTILLSLLPLDREFPEATDAPPLVSWPCLRNLKPLSTSADLRKCFFPYDQIRFDSFDYDPQGAIPIIQAKISSSEPFIPPSVLVRFLLLSRYNVQLQGVPKEEGSMKSLLMTLEAK